MTTAPRARRHHRDTDPHRVAALAAAVARAHVHPRWRPLVLETLAPYHPPVSEQDASGAWLIGTLARYAASLALVREPADIGEIVMPPMRTIAVAAGDCDDHAATVAWLAAMCGIVSAVAVYPTGPRSAHMVALVGAHSYARELAHIIDHREDVHPWPPGHGHPAITSRVFHVRR